MAHTNHPQEKIMKEEQLIKLNNGIRMPALGLGVLDRSAIDKTAGAVETAVRCGYRLIDTAAAYQNERQVGEGLRRSGIDRSQMFVTTKLWLTDYGYDSALFAFDASLRRLGIDYIDLYLLHWPVPSDFTATLESYRAAERILADGRARAIGVSNFAPRHLELLTRRFETVPAVNQIELHPNFTQPTLRELHAKLGITTQAWSPLGASVRRLGDNGKSQDPLANSRVLEIAARHKKTPAQVVLRWHFQNGVASIPKAFSPDHIAANIDIFDFALSADEMQAITALDTGVRSGADPETLHKGTFPITVDNREDA
jgi:diketogulonate reductase-like aldo/keto reductase